MASFCWDESWRWLVLGGDVTTPALRARMILGAHGGHCSLELPELKEVHGAYAKRPRKSWGGRIRTFEWRIQSSDQQSRRASQGPLLGTVPYSKSGAEDHRRQHSDAHV